MYHIPFNFGDLVHIDGDDSIKAIVIGVSFYWDSGCSIQVGWMAGGDSKACWFQPQRLSAA